MIVHFDLTSAYLPCCLRFPSTVVDGCIRRVSFRDRLPRMLAFASCLVPLVDLICSDHPRILNFNYSIQ